MAEQMMKIYENLSVAACNYLAIGLMNSLFVLLCQNPTINYRDITKHTISFLSLQAVKEGLFFEQPQGVIITDGSF